MFKLWFIKETMPLVVFLGIVVVLVVGVFVWAYVSMWARAIRNKLKKPNTALNGASQEGENNEQR